MRPTGLHFACVECVMGVWESVKRQNKMFSTAFCLICLREPELPVGQMGTSVSASASVLSSHQHWLYRLMAMQLCTRAGDQTQVLSPTSGHSSPTHALLQFCFICLV